MKVAAFLYAYPPDRLAGADLMSRDLLTALAAAGHDVTVFSTRVVAPRVQDGVKVDRRPRFRPSDRWDLLYAHPDLGSDAARYAKRLRVPYVGVVHNTSPRTGNWMLRHRPDLTVWNGHATRAAHGGEGGIICRSPLTVADHAVLRAGLNVTLVNLTAAKGGLVFRDLAERMPDVQFLGVRGGWGTQEDRNLPPNVTVTGPLPYPLRPVWEQTDLLLMPSVAESWGRVGLEAACSGIPTIASPTLGLQEALGDCGTFVPLDDLDGWEAAIRHLLSDEAAYTALSTRCRARAAVVEEQSQADLSRFVEVVSDLPEAVRVVV